MFILTKNSMTVVITGGTGTIGKRLSAMLIQKGYQVIILTRKVKETTPESAKAYAHWNVEKGIIDTQAIGKADYIIHLAGAGVAEKRWTAKRKQEIVDSRTQSSALLVKALRNTANQVKAVISSSATGYAGQYGKGVYRGCHAGR
jgi:NAD dependent epimerase/dehydratase family enzyme